MTPDTLADAPLPPAPPAPPAGRSAGAADGSTFAPALALLPTSVRADVERLYRVLRSIDDLVDEDDPCAAERVAAVEAWSRGRAADTPETRALGQLAARRPFPRGRLLEFCAGMRHDLARATVRDERDFARYCQQAGGSVGVVLAHVLGTVGEGDGADHDGATRAGGIEDGSIGEAAANRREAETGMAALGRAMQVTNILRDIDEDRAHGRVYVPHTAIDRHGPPTPGAREALLREWIPRADALYEEGARAIPLLREGGAAMALAADLYREILRQLERDGFGARPGRAVVPAWRRRELIAKHRPAANVA